MRGAWIQRTLLLLTLIAAVSCFDLVRSLPESLSTQLYADLGHIVAQGRNMQVLRAHWIDAQGISWEVKTPRVTGESLERWTARHDEAVTALAAAHPPA